MLECLENEYAQRKCIPVQCLLPDSHQCTAQTPLHTAYWMGVGVIHHDDDNMDDDTFKSFSLKMQFWLGRDL